MAPTTTRPAGVRLFRATTDIATQNMTNNELLDAHQARLAADPGYLAIWNRVQAEPPEIRLLVAMQLWGSAAANLWAMLSGIVDDLPPQSG